MPWKPLYLINRKSGILGSFFFFSPQTHQCHQDFGILNFLNFCFSQLKFSSHDFEFKSLHNMHIKQDFEIKWLIINMWARYITKSNFMHALCPILKHLVRLCLPFENMIFLITKLGLFFLNYRVAKAKLENLTGTFEQNLLKQNS